MPLPAKANEPQSVFETLYSVDISTYVQTRPQGGRDIQFLEWAVAWKLTKQIYPDAKFKIREFEDIPFLETKFGVIVSASVTIYDETESDWYPVEPDRDGVITVFEITTAHQRALVKCLGRLGLGLKLWEKAEREGLGSSSQQKPGPSSSEYHIDLGPKNRATGKTLDEAGYEDVLSNYNFWKDKAKDGKPLAFVKAAEAWLSTHQSTGNYDDIPF